VQLRNDLKSGELSLNIFAADLYDVVMGRAKPVYQDPAALALSVALSKKLGKNLPWPTVRDAIDGALRARLLERSVDSGAWPGEFTGAEVVKLQIPKVSPPPPPPPTGV
jgi:hypothetical protein